MQLEGKGILDWFCSDGLNLCGVSDRVISMTGAVPASS